MIFGRLAPRLGLDSDGHYRIASTDPLPRLIAICLSDDTVWGDVSGLHVIEVIAPGESADIHTGSVELRWNGALPSDIVQVHYELPVNSLRHPLFTFHTTSENRWVPESPLLLDAIPLSVHELQLNGHVLTLELHDGELQRMDVGPAQLEPSGH
jgi:hypothetical protein